MPEVVSAFNWIEAFEELSDSAFEPFDRSLGRGAEEGLELGEGEFNGVEVRTVRREVDELRCCAFDRFTDPCHFVSGQIVHHDHVTRAERRRQVLLDIAEEHVSVHRAVDHGGRREAAQSQRTDEGRRLPVAVGDVIDDALAAKRPAVQPSELRMSAEFVEKRQPPDIEMRLPEAPSLTPVGDVRPQLLSRMNNFF